MKMRYWTITLLVLTASIAANAQATRTWVSGVGDDVNPCSRTAPCKTWAGAISKTAAGGEIDALDPGGFGVVTITKAITIDGNGTLASILSTGSPGGINVQAGSNDVVIIRNISMSGAGTTLGSNGIRFVSGKALIVENCDLGYYSNNGIDVALNQATGASVVVKNTTFTNIGAAAIRATNSNANAPVNVAIDEVTTTVAANGIIAADNSRVRVSRTVAAHSTTNGFTATGASAELDIDNSSAANNTGIGISAVGGGATVRITSNKVVGNGTGLSATGGGQIISFGNNSIGGNTTNGAPTSTVLRQ